MIVGFSPDQIDALQELANIGMGRTANALGQLLGLEVRLNIPHVEIMGIDSLVSTIRDRLANEDSIATRQAFSDGVDGEALLIFDNRPELSDANPDEPLLNDEQMLEVTNIMVGAFLGSLLEPLGAELYFSPPALVGTPLTADGPPPGWQAALVLDIEMGTHGHMDNCKLMLVFPEGSLEIIQRAVDKLLESL